MIAVKIIRPTRIFIRVMLTLAREL